MIKNTSRINMFDLTEIEKNKKSQFFLMKKVLLFLLLSVFGFSMLKAQTDSTYEGNPKCNPQVNAYLRVRHYQGKTMAARSFFSKETDANMIHVVLFCNNREEVISLLAKMKFQTNAITSNAITAYISVDSIEVVANLKSVKRLSGMQKYNLYMEKARPESKVDDVHNGTGIETPYTGKGVVIGIIDQGFLYAHPAYRVTEDSTRIIAVWDMSKAKRTNPVYGSKNILALDEDGIYSSHATHVTGIAAGGKVMGSSTYYGVAPDAEIIMIPSNFNDADIVDGVKFVKTIAAQKNAPWVVNMSFGNTVTTADGTDDICILLDSLVEPGGAIVAAAGNAGGIRIHSRYDYVDAVDTAYFLINHNAESYMYVSFYGSDTTKFKVIPYIYNTTTKAMTKITSAKWFVSGSTTEYDLNAYDRKYSAFITVYLSSLLTDYRTSNEKIVFVIPGSTGHRVDGIINYNGDSEFDSIPNDTTFAKGDYLSSVGSPALARNVIAVGSYVTANKWTNISGQTYGYNSCAPVGSLSYFSAHGPTLDETLLKPDVCAPGQRIISSIKKNSEDYGSDLSCVCSKVIMGDSTYYYGVMQGTSMSCPLVTGVVALWLQANPYLTHDQIVKIIKESSTPFTEQTQSTWDAYCGYGKINAYAGLKYALNLLSVKSINNTTEPLTILKKSNEWRLLFNSGELFAHIALYNLQGCMVMNRRLNNISCGQEEIVSFSGLAHGVYILRVQTQNSTMVRKIIIE